MKLNYSQVLLLISQHLKQMLLRWFTVPWFNSPTTLALAPWENGGKEQNFNKVHARHILHWIWHWFHVWNIPPTKYVPDAETECGRDAYIPNVLSAPMNREESINLQKTN